MLFTERQPYVGQRYSGHDHASALVVYFTPEQERKARRLAFQQVPRGAHIFSTKTIPPRIRSEDPMGQAGYIGLKWQQRVMSERNPREGHADDRSREHPRG